MEQPTRFIGMDVHKETIVVAVTATGDVGKAAPYGTFPNTAAALEKLVKRLRQAGNGPLKFCYEAGPCGYGIHRTLTRLGEGCMVVAPSMIPRKSGERQKNDKRDADGLAVLHRGQGCSTLSTIVPLEQGIEATQRGGVSVLAEGADLVAAQDVVAEAA
jgi:transposase